MNHVPVLPSDGAVTNLRQMGSFPRILKSNHLPCRLSKFKLDPCENFIILRVSVVFTQLGFERNVKRPLPVDKGSVRHNRQVFNRYIRCVKREVAVFFS